MRMMRCEGGDGGGEMIWERGGWDEGLMGELELRDGGHACRLDPTV
jgi:hypothetical protein